MMLESAWNTLLKRFEEHLKAERGLAPLTVRNYLTDVSPLYDYMQVKGFQRLEDLDRTALRGYLAWLSDLGYVRASIVRKTSTLRTFLRWLLRHGLIERDPLPQRGAMKVESRLPRFLSQEEAARLVEAPEMSDRLGPRDRALLDLIYSAGLRVSEAAGLDTENVDLEARQLRVTGKGSKQRIVLIGNSARSALALYVRELRPSLVNRRSGSALFLNRYGGRLSQRSIQEKVRRYAINLHRVSPGQQGIRQDQRTDRHRRGRYSLAGVRPDRERRTRSGPGQPGQRGARASRDAAGR